MLKKIKEKLESMKYKKENGAFALENRARIEELQQMIKSIPRWRFPFGDKAIASFLEQGYFDYQLFLMPYDDYYKQYRRCVFSDVGLHQYAWLEQNPLTLKFDIEDLPLMKQFQEQLVVIHENHELYSDLMSEINLNNLVEDDYPELNVFLENINQATENMEKIVNPISKKVKDNRSLEDVVQANLSNALSKASQPNQLEVSKKDYQLESLRQLELVTEDEKVSDSTREEAKQTIRLIEDTLEKEKEQVKKEQAEMHARAVIQTSKFVHGLPISNHQGT